MNAQAPPFPTNPRVGQWYENWVWNGCMWVCSPALGQRVQVQIFAVPGGYVYMPSTGLVTAVVECIGGGGGGGGATAEWNGVITDAGWTNGGGGGASGGYSKKYLDVSLLLGGINVTVGSGGAGGSPTTDGAPGVATSFGVLCVANGGNGGDVNLFTGTGTPTDQWGQGGKRAPIGVGDITAAGNAGGSGQAVVYQPAVGAFSGSIVWGGQGGAGFFTGAGVAVFAYTTESGGNASEPSEGGFTGSGGEGGASSAAANPSFGNPGGAGLCVVTEYCWADGGSGCIDPCGGARVQAGFSPRGSEFGE